MRNRNLITKKLDNLEATLITLQQIVNRQSPIETYKANIIKAQGYIVDIKDLVEAENFTDNELNKY
jgi:hypothetical protein